MTTYTVSSGHRSSRVTINSGDKLVVLHGGVAVATTVNRLVISGGYGPLFPGLAGYLNRQTTGNNDASGN
jgi:autotransporter passenger strand-loop-strand repeat protein